MRRYPNLLINDMHLIKNVKHHLGETLRHNGSIMNVQMGTMGCTTIVLKLYSNKHAANILLTPAGSTRWVVTTGRCVAPTTRPAPRCSPNTWRPTSRSASTSSVLTPNMGGYTHTRTHTHTVATCCFTLRGIPMSAPTTRHQNNMANNYSILENKAAACIMFFTNQNCHCRLIFPECAYRSILQTQK